MHYRILGKTNYKISEVGFGSWAIGGSWGDVDDKESLKTLRTAVERGINFFDTADVYGDGRSEKLLAKLKKEVSTPIYIATKAGRRLSPHIASGYTGHNIEKFVNRSLQNLQVETLDLLQLHCPPTEVYYHPELFEYLDTLVQKGKIRYYGVSVEKVEEALKAIEYPHVSTVQIIYNIFRERPAELFFPRAKEKNIGLIVRVPLASGLLTGKMTKETTFQETDHRQFNRHGEAFDQGETFAGVDFEKGIDAVEKIKQLVPAGMTLPQMALRWILMNDAVSCVIPGAKRPEQVIDNTKASDLSSLSTDIIEQLTAIYTADIKPSVHHRW